MLSEYYGLFEMVGIMLIACFVMYVLVKWLITKFIDMGAGD